MYAEGGGKLGLAFVDPTECVGRLLGVEGVEERTEVMEREWYEGTL